MRSSLYRSFVRQARSRGPTVCRACFRQNSTESSKWSTPLARQLTEAITTTGPIPVASFMRQCLTSDLGGYYSSELSPDGRDQFGVKGDFVTSPEISQIFGELIGLWVVAEWIAQGRRSSGVQLLEIGPGRGTLMDDMLRTIRNFPDLAKAIDAVFMIEASPALRKSQHQLLCGDKPLTPNDNGYTSTSRHSRDLKIQWAEDLRLIAKDPSKTPFIIAHEFFDALPIHIFQSAKPSPESNKGTIQTPTGPIQAQRRLPQQNQWREMLVSPTPSHRLQKGDPEFELSLSKTATPHSMYLPETSPRYKALKSTEGSIIEISPESQAYARDFAIRIGGPNPTSPQSSPQPPPSTSTISHTSDPDLPKPTPSGAALIIDYGPASTIPINSLRGIRSHKLVSPFSLAGQTDISADVDFLALAEAAIEGSPGVEVHGPVDQGRFLTAIGIQERAAQLVKRAMESGRRGTGGEKGDERKEELTEVVKRVEAGWKRLVDQGPQGMGRLYQVLAVLPYTPREGERRRPVGFGGDVQL